MAPLFALLSLTLCSTVFASDPIGILRIPHGTKMPKKSFVEFPYVGYRGEDPELEVLVWAEGGTVTKPKYKLRDDKGKSSWLEPSKAFYVNLENELLKSSTLVLETKKWNMKLRTTPGGATSVAVTPPVWSPLQFDSELDFGPPNCLETGTVTDKSGRVWKKESCKPGLKVDLFETPDGAPIRLSGLSGALEEVYRPTETEMQMAFVSYNVKVPFAEKLRRAILVYEQKPGWAKARMRLEPPYNGRWAWIRLSSTGGKIKPLTEQSKAMAIEENPPEPASREMFWVKARQFATASGQRWARVDVYKEDLCSFTEAPKVLANGWVPLMNAPNSLQFSITTCD